MSPCAPFFRKKSASICALHQKWLPLPRYETKKNNHNRLFAISKILAHDICYALCATIVYLCVDNSNARHLAMATTIAGGGVYGLCPQYGNGLQPLGRLAHRRRKSPHRNTRNSSRKGVATQCRVVCSDKRTALHRRCRDDKPPLRLVIARSTLYHNVLQLLQALHVVGTHRPRSISRHSPRGCIYGGSGTRHDTMLVACSGGYYVVRWLRHNLRLAGCSLRPRTWTTLHTLALLGTYITNNQRTATPCKRRTAASRGTLYAANVVAMDGVFALFTDTAFGAYPRYAYQATKHRHSVWKSQRYGKRIVSGVSYR